jgi:signal transduction histidine kinase
MFDKISEKLPVEALETDVSRPYSGQLSMLSQHLQQSLQALLAELRDEEDQPSLESVRAYLTAAVARALAAESGVLDTLSELRGGRLEETPQAPYGATEVIKDATAAQLALVSLQRLQRSLLSSVLSYLSITGNTSIEIEGMFEALAQAEDALIEGWFSTESLRRTELLAQVMHDFRSPLTSVFFLADALYAGLSGELSESQKHQVGLVFTGALSLLTLVDNVLSSRNLETGTFKLESVPFSVHALCEEVERIARPLADQADLGLEFKLECRGARVGDQEVLRRILLNLVNNAISYTDEGGVVARFEDRDDDLLIQVDDTGPGIDEQMLMDLFKTFRRSTETRHGQRRFSGSGLGLSICHRLTHLAGGEIWVESEVGKGSTFFVRLPFAPLS